MAEIKKPGKSLKQKRKAWKEKDYAKWNSSIHGRITELTDAGMDEATATRIILLEDRVEVLEKLSHDWYIQNKKRVRTYVKP